jgi:hypothetical protein
MFDTTRLLLLEITRSVRQKMRSSPILYFFFSLMMFFSVVMFGFLAFFLLRTDTSFHFLDVFYVIFFLFLMKSASDLHHYFIAAPQVGYALSTPWSHRKTVGGIVLSILGINLLLWFGFSALFLLVVAGLRVPMNYPVEYLLFSVDILVAIVLGCSLALHFFSSRRYRALPAVVLLLFFWFSQSMLYIALLAPVAVLQCVWSLSYAMESFRFVNRKERTKERVDVRIRSLVRTVFFREVTVTWRERLYFSFVSMSVFTALGTGYLYLYGTDLFIPETIQKMIKGFLPSLFVFLGCYVVVMYAAVFPALNLFLTEEKTLWILRNLPVKNETIVYGKTLSLSLCFLTTLPYLAFVPVFLGTGDLLFLLWFLVFSFLAAVILAVPLGVKYAGKKSDILLLYSVAMILFVLLSVVGAGMNILRHTLGVSILLLCLLMLALEATVLFLSLKLSARLLSFGPKKIVSSV